MVNRQRLDEALAIYNGQPASLSNFASVAEQELGENWSNDIYDVMINLNEQQQEKLDHVYHYYGATLSWGETQEYLAQNDPLNLIEVVERLPILEYWLKFFGEPGKQILTELAEKIGRQYQQETMANNPENYQQVPDNNQSDAVSTPRQPNRQRLDDALTAYTGQAESLNEFSIIAEQELGENWSIDIYEVMTGLSEQEKEKLDHVCHYYGATLSWAEVTEYINQTEPLDMEELNERIPALEYWLKFFGEPGTKILNDLAKKMRQQSLQGEQ